MGGRALLVVSVGVTPLDIMVQWKMSCHLMEELPVAAGRSVATGAMCVNLFPCHFFCPHYPFIPPLHHLHLFLSTLSFPLHPTSLSLPPLLCDKLLLAVDLLVVKSASCAEGTPHPHRQPPLPRACRHHLCLIYPPAQPLTTACVEKTDILSNKSSLHEMFTLNGY